MATRLPNQVFWKKLVQVLPEDVLRECIACIALPGVGAFGWSWVAELRLCVAVGGNAIVPVVYTIVEAPLVGQALTMSTWRAFVVPTLL